MEESKMEYIEEVREAYERTLKGSAEHGTEEFACDTLPCKHCPFCINNGSCSDSGTRLTVKAWQQWWYEMTGERDTRTEEEILAEEQTEESVEDSTEETVEKTVESAAETEDGAEVSEDTPRPTVPTVPTVDIIWTTAMGAVKHRAGHIALLDGEMRQFSKAMEVWISEMIKPDTCRGIADCITFVARDSTGAVLANVELFAEMFGKRKVWESTGW